VADAWNYKHHLINHENDFVYQPKGYFTPPYETEESLRARLSKLFAEAEVTRYEGIACFRCRKAAL